MPAKDPSNHFHVLLSPHISKWIRDRATHLYGDRRRTGGVIATLVAQEIGRERLAVEELKLRIEAEARWKHAASGK